MAVSGCVLGARLPGITGIRSGNKACPSSYSSNGAGGRVPEAQNQCPHPKHTRYPHQLRDLAITKPNQVRCADITYIPMRKGFLYLVAIMDWHSRKVLS